MEGSMENLGWTSTGPFTEAPTKCFAIYRGYHCAAGSGLDGSTETSIEVQSMELPRKSVEPSMNFYLGLHGLPWKCAGSK